MDVDKMIYYERFGDESNEALLLLHSGGMAGIEWKPQIEALSHSFNLFVPDLTGHGKSLIPKGETLSISVMGKAVCQMLFVEGVSKVHLCGSSMGGAVALWIALNFPEIVNKLVIYRIGYSKDMETYAQTRAMANAEYWKQYGMHQWLSKIHAPQGDQNSWEAVIANVSEVLNPETSEHNHRLEDLNNIEAKTLLIAGDRDPLIPVSTLLEMQNAIPDCAIWVMPNASHITATNTWRAPAFTEELVRFLR